MGYGTYEISPDTKQEQELKKPPFYQVVILNDDYTPMDFVVLVLQSIFFMDEVAATKVMLQVHHIGNAICGVYTRDIAETKVELVIDFARANEYPLLCQMEKVPGD